MDVYSPNRCLWSSYCVLGSGYLKTVKIHLEAQCVYVEENNIKSCKYNTVTMYKLLWKRLVPPYSYYW